MARENGGAEGREVRVERRVLLLSGLFGVVLSVLWTVLLMATSNASLIERSVQALATAHPRTAFPRSLASNPAVLPPSHVVALEDKLDTLARTAATMLAQHNGLRAALEGLVDDARDATAGGEERWLVIGIPTVPRDYEEDYLTQTLAALAAQLPSQQASPFYHKVLVVVMSNSLTTPHPSFLRAREAFAASDKSQYFWFVHNDGVHKDPVDESQVGDVGDDNVPGFKVRKQSRDVARLLQYVSELPIKAPYYLFMEDDFFTCENGLLTLHHVIEKANTYYGTDGWISIRVGYGLNGILMHTSDLGTFASYLLKHQRRRPPDHLMVEWFLGEVPESAETKRSRVAAAYRFNVFDHLGLVSSVRDSIQRVDWPTCFQPLADALFESEGFNATQCPKDDLWPCNSAPKDPVVVNWWPEHLTVRPAPAKAQ